MPMEPGDPGEELKGRLGTKADWNMTLYDFERWARVLEEMLKISIQVLDKKYQYCDRLFSLEQSLYMEWHGIMIKMKKDKEWDDLIQKGVKLSVKKKTDDGNMMNSEFPDYLLELYRKLHDFKQEAGMGIPLKSDMSSGEKLKRALA